MRKKEENVVNRKTVCKRNTNPVSSGANTLLANNTNTTATADNQNGE